MAQSTINKNSVEPLGGPNLGTSVEQGDGWNAAVDKLNAMFADLYGTAGGIPAGITNGSAAYTVVAGSTAADLTPQGIIDLSTVGDYTLGLPVKGVLVDLIFRSTQGSTSSGSNINVTAKAGSTFDGLNTIARATAASVVNKGLQLIGLSSTRWAVLSNVGLGGTLGLATV